MSRNVLRGKRSRHKAVSRTTRVLANSIRSCRRQGRHVRRLIRIEISVRSRGLLRRCHAIYSYTTVVQPRSGFHEKMRVP